MKKKSILALMMVAALGVTSVGCSQEQPASMDKGKEGSQKEVVIKVWGASDFLKGDDSPGQQTVKEFNEKYKGKIRVEARYMPWTEFNTAIQAGVSSNELPDVFQTPQNMDIRTIAASGWIRPYEGIVSDNWKKQFYPGSFAEGINVIGGKTYAWPITGPELDYMLYYNKEVLQKSGLDPEKPPKTWDELQEMAKTVTAKGKGDIFGLVFGGADNDFTRAAQGLAGGISPEDAGTFNYKTGKFTFDSKAITDAIKYMLTLKADGSILPSSYTMKETESGVMFGEGKAAFLIMSRFKMWHIKRDTPNAKFGLAMVPTPDGKPPKYYYTLAKPAGYMIWAKTKHPEEAGKFIEEGLASSAFYNKYIKSGVALSPIESLNKNKTLYPYPEYETFVKLHNDLLLQRPDSALRNPETEKVITELGAFSQPKIKPGFKDIMQSLMTGAQKDVDGLMKSYNEKMNKGLNDAVEKAKQAGAKVSMNDFIFPNWDLNKDYTEKDYKDLKN
jgi:multiple sugar transport system substrate-binding protein